mmetsp:Transcript_12654/g.22392  ORF Transcript_12654/g.22392 Transcript_12654/m.22392 type:complete len:374 (+) Transcript_12654:152-1273(+)|eukprot:CAMPEP_0119116008 /NCGR_PEP_ID=MMETSP1180-20130426/52050_1 /TAXON_ID=3052 ORGANISM="Chlamydomonas cf sp, Strain CCMP681" /NCGR_SAMPLE_ID=MMETSP1180 /ASSEMBLY_ACC=CAM_ASM_000741 /LENGTH=373 /DNA_ID=CAMNT_0007105119 /DNA_START=122 /DNA_END=1243 /DNA_ORIENTATION=+
MSAMSSEMGEEASFVYRTHMIDQGTGDDDVGDGPDDPRMATFVPSLAAKLTLAAPTTLPPERKARIIQIEKKRVLKGHAEAVMSICFSPDSLTLASGSDDKTVRLWDSASGNLKTIFSGHLGRILGLRFIGSGTILFSSSKDKTVVEWDLLRNQHRKTLEGHTNVVWSCCLTQDGTQAISVSHDETIRYWDTMSGALLKTIKKVGAPGPAPGTHHTSTIYKIQPSPNGKMFATCSADKSVRIWDLASGTHIKALMGHTSHVTGVDWVSNTKLVSCSWDETIRLWDLDSATTDYVYTGHNSKVHCVAVSADGDCFATGAEDKLVKVWRISTLEHFVSLAGHTEEVMGVAWSGDGELLASCSLDKTIRTWKILSV